MTARSCFRASRRPGRFRAGGVARGRWLAAALLLVQAVPSMARAEGWVVRGRTLAQFYELRGWRTRWDTPVEIPRQRLLQSLSLFGDDLAEGQDLDLTLGMRVETDLGFRPGEPEALDGVDRWRVEVLVANLRWRDPTDRLELGLGRLLRLDPVDFRYVDGVEGVGRLGPLRLTGWGGFLVKDGSPLASPTFEYDGVRSSDEALADRAPSDWPFLRADFHDDPSPTLGLGLGLVPTPGTLAEVGWHRTWSAGDVDAERAWARLSGRYEGLEAAGLLEWDALNARVSFAQAGVEGPVAAGVALGGEVLRVVPTFDGDSIWNLFAIGPLEEARLFGRWRPSPSLTARAGLRARRYVDVALDTSDGAAGGEAALEWRPGPARGLGASASWLGGWGGDEGYLRVWGRWPLSGRLDGTLQLAGGYVGSDAAVAGYQTAFVGARGRLTWHFDRWTRLAVVLESNHSRYLFADVRAYAALDLGAGS